MKANPIPKLVAMKISHNNEEKMTMERLGQCKTAIGTCPAKILSSLYETTLRSLYAGGYYCFLRTISGERPVW